MKYKYNGSWVDLSIKALDGMPIGSIILFAGTDIPTGWMVCEGATLNEEEYPELYDVIGHTYGGSGLDFMLPNFKGRVPVGINTQDTDFNTLGKTGGSKYLQRHQHEIAHTYLPNGSTSKWGINGISTGGDIETTGDAGTGNSGNLQPYLVVNYIIKVSNTTPTMASVVNASNNSTEDAYSCNYVNGITGVILYNNADGDTGNIILSETSANFKYIEIFYAKGDGSYNNFKVNSPNSKNITLYCCNAYNNTSLQELWKYITISGTTITSNNGFARNSSTTGTGNITQENQVKIFRVVGYR